MTVQRHYHLRYTQCLLIVNMQESYHMKCLDMLTMKQDRLDLAQKPQNGLSWTSRWLTPSFKNAFRVHSLNMCKEDGVGREKPINTKKSGWTPPHLGYTHLVDVSGLSRGHSIQFVRVCTEIGSGHPGCS